MAEISNVICLRDCDEHMLVAIPNAATGRTDLAFLSFAGRSDRAYLPFVPSHWVSVQWVDSEDEPFQPGSRDCWAWLECGTLYLPSDGQTDQGQRDEETDLPLRDARWYDPATGCPAIWGLPGATLTRLV